MKAFIENAASLRKYSENIHSFVRDDDHEIYLIINHPFSINKDIRMNQKYQLCSIIRIAIEDYSLDLFRWHPVLVEINFAWHDEKEKSYPFSFPQSINYYRTPLNFQSKNILFWNSDTNKFSIGKNKNKIESLEEYIGCQIKRHLLVTRKFLGLPLRIGRYLKYNCLEPLMNAMLFLCKLLFYITTGKQVRYKQPEYLNNPHFTIGEKVNHTVDEGKSAEIEFFGMTMNAVPVITFSVINIAIYIFLFCIDNIPELYENIINNAFLSIVYIIVSYSLLYYGISYLLLLFGKLILILIENTNKYKTPILKAYDSL